MRTSVFLIPVLLVFLSRLAFALSPLSKDQLCENKALSSVPAYLQNELTFPFAEVRDESWATDIFGQAALHTSADGKSLYIKDLKIRLIETGIEMFVEGERVKFFDFKSTPKDEKHKGEWRDYRIGLNLGAGLEFRFYPTQSGVRMDLSVEGQVGINGRIYILVGHDESGFPVP